MLLAAPLECVRWTLDFVLRHVETAGEGTDVIRRSIGFLENLLREPDRANLHEAEEFAWLPWSYRLDMKGAGPLARLVWAAMGAVLLAQPGEPTPGELPGLFRSDNDPRTVAESVVWVQCAMAIHMLGHDDPQIPQAVAIMFTKTVCGATRPAECSTLGYFEWTWEGLAFEIAVLQDNDRALHLQYEDRLREEPLFSGPFSTMQEVDERFALLKHAPKRIRLERIL